jgi:molybdopterin-guanine dinucleotide biosynthesis protein A
MYAVITAGGPIDGEYARLAGTDRKALAPVRSQPMIAYALEALRGAGIAEIAVVGDERVARACRPWNVRAIEDAGSGRANVLRALDAWPSDDALLYLTCDMPYISETQVRWFLERAHPSSLAMPLTEHDDYVQRFPGAPRAGITLGGERVVNGGLFHIPAGAQPRIRELAATLFDARKAPWKMAAVAGPAMMMRFAFGRASVVSLETRARSILSIPVAALRSAPPELAFDVDSEEDYRFALAHD